MKKFLGSLTVALLLLVGAAGSASAHSALIGTIPADGETLATAPAAITLQFNEEPLDGMVDVAITDAAGAMVATSTAAVEGVEVAIPWPGTIGAGDYTVAYRVVSADGHPITGTFTFTYTGTPTNPDEEVTVDTTAGQEVVTEVAQSESGSSTPLIIGIAAVVILALGGLIVWRRTRR
jgi:hypothetical protein